MLDHDTVGYVDAFVTDDDVVGLYPAEMAAAAARGSWSDPGSGPMRPDD